MSKLLAFTAVAVVTATAIGIASLIISIITLTNTNSIKNNQKVTPAPQPNSPPCTSNGAVNNSAGYQAAANYLLNGLDQTVDPCEDFYAFTCNKFLGQTNLDQLGLARLGTYDQSQVIVNQAIVDALKNVDVKDTKVSKTERITKLAMDACAQSLPVDLSAKINAEVTGLFGGVPFLGGKLSANANLFKIAGTVEQTHALGTLMFSWATVDYQQISKNALYASQPDLSLPRDYYVKPQFIQKLTSRRDAIVQIMEQFAIDVGQKNDTTLLASLTAAAQDVVNFEVLIAMASWPDDLMRNYKQQYNRYSVAQLKTAYPNIDWTNYLGALFNGVQSAAQVQADGVVVSQPSYFAWLDSVFNGNLVPKETIANYIITQILFDDGGFLSNSLQKVVQKHDYVPYMMRRGKGLTRIGRQFHRKFDNEDAAVYCLDMIMAYMPYGPGYVYVKAQTNRDQVAADVKKQTSLIVKNFLGMVDTLGWMTDDSKAQAKIKATNLVQNYGWPDKMFGDFKNFDTVDDYNSDYASILTMDPAKDYYQILLTLKKGMEVREAFKLLVTPAGKSDFVSRSNFLQSPAMVNAWYQPERNSITFPYAAWNPPYYNFDYPQAYNFAGQGGTGGHELTHGYDDEGVQFNFDGSMTNCTWNECGWMDTTSQTGFTDMAQCVVSQFSTQCCPEKTGNVHCANGATTQGENIADLGGQQAAYRAYRELISERGSEEDRLPGLQQYSPNQIFWITYGYSWCMKQSDNSLVSQLLTNPHSPAQCRTNQVMQDIPQFGKDFNCKQGSAMFPMPANRCKVWVGY